MASPDFKPGIGILGQAGKAGWSIACRGMPVPMGKPDIGKGPENLFAVERVALGGCLTLMFYCDRRESVSCFDRFP